MMHKSDCPINLGLEIFGDRWTLLILRDLLFNNKRYYREFFKSEEGIASNTLASRLSMLEKEQIICKEPDDSHKQKIRYSLTEKGIELVPILMEIGLWTSKHYEIKQSDKERILVFEQGKKEVITKIVYELKTNHKKI